MTMGTCVRIAMREIVDWYRQNSTKENDPLPFKAIFTGEGASKSLPQAVFFFVRGKPRIQQQVLQKPKFGDSHKKYYDEDAETLESQKNISLTMTIVMKKRKKPTTTVILMMDMIILTIALLAKKLEL